MIHEQDESSRSCRDGLLIIGHGTRDVEGTAEFHHTVRQVQQRVEGVAVQPCFLELARPSIPEGAEQLAERGSRQITALPMMLLAAGHVRRDIPAALAAAARVLADRYGPIPLEQTHHLGRHARMVELSAKRFHEAIAEIDSCAREPVPLQDTLLLMVGRGSRDPDVIQQMRHFVRRRCQQTPVARAETCYMAMAQPSLDSMLGQIEVSRFRRIVVQPHLLYRGRLLSQLRETIDQAASRHPGPQWQLTRHLGPDALLTDVIMDLARG